MHLWWAVRTFCLALFVVANELASRPRCIMYLTGQHPIIPDADKVRHVTHVILAFMSSDLFNDVQRTDWPLFLDVPSVRARFPPHTKVMIAIGGWGDTLGFSAAAVSSLTRQVFAAKVAGMVAAVGADGVDVGWEYPGGNGEDYRAIPNTKKKWEMDAYPLLLGELRAALGSKAIISAAVPGLQRDMLAFGWSRLPRIMRHLNFLNVMTYDLMNRRDNVTEHHTGAHKTLVALEEYVQRGAAPQNLNFGLAFYAKWFRTQHTACFLADNRVGCPTLVLENPETGEDKGLSGSFSWHDFVPDELVDSLDRALKMGQYDKQGGAFYYWDHLQSIWWTFDTPAAIKLKKPLLTKWRRGVVGGVFAWGLGEDAPLFEHLTALNELLDEVKSKHALKANKNEL